MSTHVSRLFSAPRRCAGAIPADGRRFEANGRRHSGLFLDVDRMWRVAIQHPASTYLWMLDHHYRHDVCIYICIFNYTYTYIYIYYIHTCHIQDHLYGIYVWQFNSLRAGTAHWVPWFNYETGGWRDLEGHVVNPTLEHLDFARDDAVPCMNHQKVGNLLQHCMGLVSKSWILQN